MHRRVAFIACAIAAVGFSPAAHAATFCVGSSFNLRLALQDAATNGQADVIRLRPGTYGGAPGINNTYQLEYDSNEPLTIEGVVPAGTGCSAILGLPGDVVLDGGNLYGVLSFRAALEASGEFRLRNLRVTRGLGASQRVACVRLRVNGSAVMHMSHVLVDECTAPSTGMAQAPALDAAVFFDSQMLLQNNVFVRNRSDVGSVIQLGGNVDSGFTFSSNTVAYNRVAAGFASGSTSSALGAINPVTVFASNNVFHENTRHQNQAQRADLGIGAGTQLYLSANHLNHLTGDPILNLFGSTGDARLWGPNDPRPRPDSPLIDSGRNDGYGGLLATDADLAPRVQGARVDKGAYEFDQVFRNGFE